MVGHIDQSEMLLDYHTLALIKMTQTMVSNRFAKIANYFYIYSVFYEKIIKKAVSLLLKNCDCNKYKHEKGEHFSQSQLRFYVILRFNYEI